jgi:photosynthetic reaction center H subunit
MSTGAITGYIDIAQVTLYAFWIFFAGLIYYLRTEDKREGYPLLATDGKGRRGPIQGFPPVPKPKVFLLPHGGIQTAPRVEPTYPIAALPAGGWPGAPLVPTGNPMLDGVGPAAYAHRADVPDALPDGAPRHAPLRADPEFFLAPEDPDPRGMRVIAADNRVAGIVTDVWVDRSDVFIRYLEVDIGTALAPRSVLMPMTAATVDGGRKVVKVGQILASQFLGVPALRNPDQITLLEEDKISAYFAGGQLYATPARLGPLL